MSRIDHEDLADPERVLAAASLRLAKSVETRLTELGVPYAVEVEPIGRTLLFRSVRMGAVFYVSAAQAAFCREQLAAAGFGNAIIANGSADSS